MTPLLAADGAEPALVPLLISTVAVLAGVVVVLFWQLLKAKDEKLGIATEFGKDYSTDKEKTRDAMLALATRVEKLTEIVEAALDQRDVIVRDGMDLLRAVRSDIANLARERTP